MVGRVPDCLAYEKMPTILGHMYVCLLSYLISGFEKHRRREGRGNKKAEKEETKKNHSG